MNPSVELKNVMLRLYESESAGDVSAMGHLISRQDGVVRIGTDPNEWWAGYDTIFRVHKAQWQEMGGVQLKSGELSAFVEGKVGWVADRAKIQLPNGQEIPIRVTTVFHQEDGEWKIVQHHVSVGVSNAEVVGTELTTS